MQKLSFVLSLSVLLTVVGCKRNVAPQNSAPYITIEGAYGISDTLRGELYKEAIPLRFDPFRLYKTSSGFLGTNCYNYMGVHLADTITGKFIASGCPMTSESIKMFEPSIIERTNGPIQTVAHSDYNTLSETLFVADVFSNSVSSFKVQKDSIVQTNRYHMPMTNAYMVDFKIINDSTFVLLMLHPNAHKLYKVDAVKGIITDSLDYHIYENPDIDHSKIKVLSLDMCITPDRKNIIINDRVYNVLKSYKISENGFELEKEWMYFEPSMAIKDGVPQLNDDHLKGEGNVFATNEYIYMTSAPETIRSYKENLEYYGKYTGRYTNELIIKYVLVFKRDDLSFVTSFVFDERIDWINVMPDNKTIYASVNIDKSIANLKNNHKRYISKYTLPEFSREIVIHTPNIVNEKEKIPDDVIEYYKGANFYSSYKDMIEYEPAIWKRAFLRKDATDFTGFFLQDSILCIYWGRPIPTGYNIADDFARTILHVNQGQ